MRCPVCNSDALFQDPMYPTILKCTECKSKITISIKKRRFLPVSIFGYKQEILTIEERR